MYSIESTLSAIVWFRPYIREHPSKLDSCFSSLSTAYVSGGRFIIIILILSQSLLITKSCLPWSCIPTECSRYVTRRRGKNLSKRYLLLRDLVPKICKFCFVYNKGPFSSVFFLCYFYRVLDLRKQVSLSPSLLWLAIFQIITQCWKPVSLCVVHSGIIHI